MDTDWRIVAGFPEVLRGQAAALYFEAFSGKIGGVLGRDGRGERFVASVIDPAFCLSAVSGDGATLLGIAGFKTKDGAMVGGGLAEMAAVYGWVGAVLRGVLLSALERDLADGQLLMDGIAVAPQARGLGIGSALLDAVCQHALKCGVAELRLDVIDTNPRARALYERKGFAAGPTSQTGLLRHVFGFSSATTMVRTLA